MYNKIDVITCCSGEPYLSDVKITGYRIRYFLNNDLVKSTDVLPEDEARDLALGEIDNGCEPAFVGGILGVWLYRREK